MKNRTRETCTSGTVRDEAGNILIYSANDREDRGNVGIIRSPIRASILPDYIAGQLVGCGRPRCRRRGTQRSLANHRWSFKLDAVAFRIL